MALRYKIMAALAAILAALYAGYWIASQRYEAKLQALRAELTEAAGKAQAELEARLEKEKAVRQIVEEDYAKAISNADALSADIERLRKQLQSSAGSTLPAAGAATGGADGAACRRLLDEATGLAAESADAADRCAARLEGLQRWARSVTQPASDK